MVFPNDYVKSIRDQLQDSNLTGEKCVMVLRECTRALHNLTRLLNRAKTVSEKAHITSCIAQIKGFQHTLKNKKVGGGTGLKTATHRVKWEDLHSAFESRIRTGLIVNLKHKDVGLFLDDCAALFKRRIQNALRKDEALKVNAVLCGEFQIAKADVTIEENKYLNTSNFVIHQGADLYELFRKKIRDPLLSDLENFSEMGSGWALSRIVNLVVNINKYNPLRAGSYIELPTPIAKRQACINVQNPDNMCFVWSVLSALHPAKINTSLTSSYPDPKTIFNLKGIQFPITLTQIPRFERQNDVSVNVYRLQKAGKSFNVLPYFITQDKKGQHVNLLLIQDTYISEDDFDNLAPVKFHYVWIKNLSRLLSSQLSNHKTRKYICDRCLHFFGSSEKFAMHTKDCSKINDKIVPKVPSKKHATVEFKNYQFKEKVPFVIYADTECLLVPVEDDSSKNTQKYQKHVPFSVGYYVKCSYDDSLSFYRSYTGQDCMEWFVKELNQFAEDVETVFLCPLPMSELTPEEKREFNAATHCHICEKPFTEEDKKVQDHNHLNSQYRNPGHESCNLNYQDSRTVPVIFHNLSCYDGHMIIKALAKVDGRIDILPINKEKYISFTKHIANSSIKFRFLDSYRFLADGLDKLVSYLPEYPILKSQFGELTDVQFNLLSRKGVFPYDFMDDWAKLLESSLPPKLSFYNRLEDKHISKKDYEHAQSVWEKLSCQNMRDYSELYMKTDILLLADVFEKFRCISIKTYNLDPAHSYTLPGYSWQCMLYMTKQKLELLTDLDMVLFIEKGIRGGLSQCSKRYAEANNKYMPNYNSEQDECYLMYFDVNNQYGWAMSQYLPYGGFSWLSNDEISQLDVLKISDTAPTGYILEVDLEIPKELHDKFSDLPPCSNHEAPEGSKINKLLATLKNKKEYVIHYRNLKQAINLGVKVTKVHRVLSFKQSDWLKQYIDFNTYLRQNATNEFDKNFFKLLINCIFGKSIESIRHHSIVKILAKWNGRYGAEALIARPEFKSSTIIDKDLVIIEMAKTNVYFNKPIYIGMSILDIAKTTIYAFHYDYMVKTFSTCNLLYTDTDSLIYEIKNEDVFGVIRRDCTKYFDTSDYPPDNIYEIPRVNKKVLGMMKDENNGRIMTHFIGLRSKMYATKVLYTPEEMRIVRENLEEANKERDEIDQAISNLGVTKKIKGVKKSVIKNKITFEDYVECLESFTEKRISQNLIRSQKHELHTLNQSKIGLSPYDNKRRIIKSSPLTLPWGHCSIMEED